MNYYLLEWCDAQLREYASDHDIIFPQTRRYRFHHIPTWDMVGEITDTQHRFVFDPDYFVWWLEVDDVRYRITYKDGVVGPVVEETPQDIF